MAYRLDVSRLASTPVELRNGVVLDQTADHLLYARCACVLAGEEAVDDALRSVTLFAGFVAPQLQGAEELLYLARNEYRSRTGERMTGVWVPS